MGKCTCNKSSNCKTCACSKAKEPCGPKCHPNSTSCMNFAEARDVRANMSVGEIRKSLAGYQLSPVGDKDELVFRLGGYLRDNKKEKSEAAASKSEDGGAKDVSGDSQDLIKEVTRLQDEHVDLLSLSGTPITSSSSVAAMRKAYLKLTLKIHPDKHGGSAEANFAFQALVTAFETLTKPPDEEDGAVSKKKRKKVEKVVRSNKNCFKTRIDCPRCHTTWGAASLGLEAGAYNFFMQAIKQYICGLCACSFGCMTADHFCPHCRKPFDYSFEDYHRQITCGNARCNKEFGFYYHDVSARREAEVRKEAKLDEEENAKQRAQRRRRANRAGGRAPASTLSVSKTTQEELLFSKGLLDECPRCGISITDLHEENKNKERKFKVHSDEVASIHLSDCNDEELIKKRQQEKAEEEKIKNSKKNKEASQEDAQTLASWELQGRQVGQLWMLSPNLLKNQLQTQGLSCLDEDGTELDTPGLIGRLAKHLRSSKPLAITAGSHKRPKKGDGDTDDEDNGYDTVGIADADHDDLPSNMEMMDSDSLKAVCASYGIKYGPADTKKQLLKKLDLARHKGNKEMTLMLTGKKADGKLMIKDKAASKKKKAKKNDKDWGDDDDDDEEWQGSD